MPRGWLPGGRTKVSTEVDRILENTADSCRMARKKRSSHIHDCIRQDVAHRLLVSESDL